MFFRRSQTQRASRGQAMVEFAIVLPLLVLLLVMAVDFGRLFFGWVGLHNAARIGADFAAQHPDADWLDPDDPFVLQYIDRIEADSQAINCEIDDPLPMPTFPGGTDVGDQAVVGIECQFELITPIMSSLMGSPMDLGAQAVFPIRKGFVGVPTGGGGGEEEPPECALVPDTVGGTVAEARVAWTGRDFTGFFGPPDGFDDDTVTVQTTNPASTPESDCIPLTSTISVTSETAEGCTSGEVRIPLLTGQTVGDARDAWDASVFTGSFSPNGQNTSWAASQDPPAGDCAPTAADMTITPGPTPTPAQCLAPNFVGFSTDLAPGLWSGREFVGSITYRQPPPFIVDRQSLVADQRYDCNAGVELFR